MSQAGAPAVACALALVLGFAPGWLVARRLIPERDPTLRAALGIALSPFLTAAPAALLMLAGLGIQATARAIAILVAVPCVAEALLAARARGAVPARGSAHPSGGTGPAPASANGGGRGAAAGAGRDRADIVLALVLTGVVAALHASIPRSRGARMAPSTRR